MPILETIGLEKRFGGILASQNVNLAVEQGARHALIGPNGAGKTTVINLLSGVLRPSAGRIMLEGRDITGLAPHERVRLGMARTFQINQLFLDLTPQYWQFWIGLVLVVIVLVGRERMAGWVRAARGAMARLGARLVPRSAALGGAAPDGS